MRRYLPLACLSLAGWLFLSAGLAQTPMKQPALPEDPAFNPCFNSKKVGDALTTLDARTLTDYALLLAHGEKTLLRQRTGITSTKLLTVALKVAAEKGDGASMDRLDKAIRTDGDAE